MMREPLSGQAHDEYEQAITTPHSFLSSEHLDWDGLVVKVFHEPREIEELITPSPTFNISLLFVTRGVLQLSVRSIDKSSWNSYTLHPGDFILDPGRLPPNEWRWNTTTAESAQTLHIGLNRERFFQASEEIMECDRRQMILPARSGFQDALIAQMGAALRQEIEQPHAIGKLYSQTIAQMLTLHLLRHYTFVKKAVREAPRRFTHRQITSVKEFIQANLRQDLTLEILAQQSGFSAHHFTHLFHQIVGETPHQFVLRQRIERARYLMRDGDLPLAHIAETCGFADQSHLTRVFKRYYGLTPKAYRQDF